jgi:Domain of unknown function (DUF4429)
MWHMGDVLAGIHATWEFADDSVLIRFGRGIRTPKLFQVLRQRRVPHDALAAVSVSTGRRGTVVLRALPRPGADPLMDAADGQLKDSCDPYRLVLPAGRAKIAEYYAEELRNLLGLPAEVPAGEEDTAPAEHFLVAAPEPPIGFKAYDARASFDGRHVSFRWSWTGASTAKWKAGDQTYPVRELQGVEWRSPEGFEGHLRLVPRGPQGADDAAVPDTGTRERDSGGRAPADRDPAAVVFGLGYGPVHESLPFAAAVLAAVRGSGRVPVPVPALAGDPRDHTASVAERIRHLGELHRAGFVTDEEFSTKKAQLLAEL